MGDVVNLEERLVLIKDLLPQCMSALNISETKPEYKSFVELHIDITNAQEGFCSSNEIGMAAIAGLTVRTLAYCGQMGFDVSSWLKQYIGLNPPATIKALQAKVHALITKNEIPPHVNDCLLEAHRRLDRFVLEFKKQDNAETFQWIGSLLLSCVEIAVMFDKDLQHVVFELLTLSKPKGCGQNEV